MKQITYLLIIAFTLLLFSCTKKEEVKNQQKEIAGKWQKAGTSSVYEFREDGNLLLHGSNSIISGKFTFPEVDKIKIDFLDISPEGMKYPSIQGGFNIKGDSLFITYEDKGYKQLLKFAKVK
jgi:hypothetical protein